MTHHEYLMLLLKIDTGELSDRQSIEMDKHTNECPICFSLKIQDQEFMKKNHPLIIDAIIDILAEDGCESLGIPSKKEDYKFFSDMMSAAEDNTSSFEKNSSSHPVSSIINSCISPDLALTIKSFFSPLSLSAARTRSPESTLSKSLAIFEVNLSKVEGAFFTVKPQVSVTKNIMRINGIDKSFKGISVINLVIPFLKLKTIFSLSTDEINSENGVFIEKQLKDLFLTADYRDSILTELQSYSGYLEGGIVEYEDTFVAEFSIPPGLSKFLGSEKYCFILLIN
jgi:hypothetical protein